MAYSKRIDHAMDLPLTPMIKDWYAVVQDGESLIIQYGKHVIKFDGKAVRALFPSLLPLVDGSRTVEQIKERIGPEFAPAVEPALRKLMEHGLVGEGPGNRRLVASGAASALDFFSANVLEAGQPALSPAALAGKSVFVCGASLTAESLVAQLRESGVFTNCNPALIPPEEIPSETSLIVVAPSCTQYGEVRALNRRLHAGGRKWMLVAPHEGKAAFVGPIFVPGETACYECCLLRRESNAKFAKEPYISAAHATRFPQAPFTASMIATVAAYSIYQHLVADSPWPVGRIHSLEFRWDLGIEAHNVLRVPRCPVCSAVARASNPSIWAQQ